MPSSGPRFLEPPPQVDHRHDQGQAGSLPREPPRQAGRLLRPIRDRGRSGTEALAVRSPQEDRPRALPALHHPEAQAARIRGHHQEREADARTTGSRGLGHPRAGDPKPPGASEPRPHPSPHGHPGLRAGAGGRQRDQDPSAGLHRLQRRLRRRPDGGPPSPLARGAGRGPRPHALASQRVQPGERQPDRESLAGHRDGRGLPHRGERRRGEPEDRGSAGLQGRDGGDARLRLRRDRHPRAHPGPSQGLREHRERREGRGREDARQPPGAHHRRADHLQRDPARAGADAVLQLLPQQEGLRPRHRRDLRASRQGRDHRSPRRDEGGRLQALDHLRTLVRRQRPSNPRREEGTPRQGPEDRRPDREAVPERCDHRAGTSQRPPRRLGDLPEGPHREADLRPQGGSPRSGDPRGDVHRRRRRRPLPQPRVPLHELGCSRQQQSDAAARRHARPDGQAERRDHRDADPGQLPGRPQRPRVLLLHSRCPKGTGRHRAEDGGLRVSHPEALRRRPVGGGHRGRLRHEPGHRQAGDLQG